MRCCFVIERLAEIRGGAERVLLGVATEMKNRGHSVTVVSFDSGRSGNAYDTDLDRYDLSPALQTPLERTIELSRTIRHLGRQDRAKSDWWPSTDQLNLPLTEPIGSPTVQNRILWLARSVPKVAALRSWLSRNPQDTVVAFMPGAIGLTSEAVSRLKSNRPRFIASLHNLPNLDFGNRGRFNPNPIARRAAFDGLGAADAITVLLPQFVEMMPPGLAAKTTVLPNAVPAPSYSDKQREELMIGVGRLTRIKRFDYLLSTFSRISDDFPSMRLAICGDGPQMSELKALASHLQIDGRTNFLGSVGDMAAIYSKAKLMVHPALFEGFGLVITEAISRGVPVVCSRNLDSASVLVEDGVTGFLADDGAAGFEQATRRALSQPVCRDKFLAGAKRLHERFAPEKIYDQWELLIA